MFSLFKTQRNTRSSPRLSSRNCRHVSRAKQSNSVKIAESVCLFSIIYGGGSTLHLAFLLGPPWILKLKQLLLLSFFIEILSTERVNSPDKEVQGIQRIKANGLDQISCVPYRCKMLCQRRDFFALGLRIWNKDFLFACKSRRLFKQKM